jgi:hypothetical protein
MTNPTPSQSSPPADGVDLDALERDANAILAEPGGRNAAVFSAPTVLALIAAARSTRPVADGEGSS